jgi:chromosome segregation ATPase
MSAVLEEEVMEETRLARLESDVGGLKTDVSVLKTDVAHIKSDILDIKTDIREIRSELGSVSAVVAALRDEMHVSDNGLHLEMRTGFAEQRSEMNDKHASLRHEMMRTALSLKIWVLCVSGTLLAVMAHGFKWL